MARSISIADQTLHGADRYGVWVTRELDGWRRKPDEERGHVTVPGLALTIPGQVTPQRRTITLRGRLAAGSEALAREAATMVASLLDAPATMTVQSEDEVTWRIVRDPDIEEPVVRGRMMFWQLAVTALDSRRYGETHVFPMATDTQVDVYHYGTAPAPPVFEVTGSSPSGYRISYEDGSALEYTGALAAGEVHRVDMGTGRVYVGTQPGVYGTPILTLYGAVNTFRIKKGPAQKVRIAPLSAGAPLVTKCEVTDTWP